MHPSRIHLGLMLALTFSTGVIDAVGYLGLDRVFTGNMTGNVVILGMGLAGADDLPIAGPALALAGFMVGAAIGGRVLKPESGAWTFRTTALFTTVGVMMTAIAATMFLVGNQPDRPAGLAITAALAAAMGIQAATARHLAVKDITTVVVTSLITGLAADSRLGGGLSQPWVRRIAALVLISAGAVGGALALSLHLGAGVAISAVIVLAVAVIGHLTTRADPAAAAETGTQMAGTAGGTGTAGGAGTTGEAGRAGTDTAAP
jgi:uncharacterized membrane protein YoaK (UPF0700 family)